MHVDNTVKDVSRAIARLDKHARVDSGDTVDIEGINWTGLDMRISVAENLAGHVMRVFAGSKITRRDVAAMMAAHGASPYTIDRHAREIAGLMRSDIGSHRLGAMFH